MLQGCRHKGSCQKTSVALHTVLVLQRAVSWLMFEVLRLDVRMHSIASDLTHVTVANSCCQLH